MNNSNKQDYLNTLLKEGDVLLVQHLFHKSEISIKDTAKFFK